jgi:hypothetical protein
MEKIPDPTNALSKPDGVVNMGPARLLRAVIGPVDEEDIYPKEETNQ